MSDLSDETAARRAMRRIGASLCGRYNVVKLIGLGGMAAVYAGFHRNGLPVAIKVLDDRLALDPEIQKLFRREAQLANRVGHPGVVQVTDDDVTEDGCVFLVMPLLEGETVRARAERSGGKLPVSDVVVIVHAVLDVLGAAHAQKIVHRDVKPENLFITSTGDIKVLDFGIGRFFEAHQPGAGTTAGRPFGTPAYMAPEQALGRTSEVDGQTDIWAVGATMFSLLTGRFVHEATNPTEAAVIAGVRAARGVRTVAPAVPEALAAVIDRALAFERAERWPDAGAMAAAITEAWLSVSGTTIGAVPRLTSPASARVDATNAARTQVPAGGDAWTPLVSESAHAERAAGESLTLTTNGAVANSRGARTTPGRARARLAISFGGVLGLVGLAAEAAVHFRGPGAATSTSEANAAAPSAPSPALDVTGDVAARSDVPFPAEAIREYTAGIQLWRDASAWEAGQHFIAASRLAPDFAAAHLWLVLAAKYVDTDVRQHYNQASTYRVTLTQRQRQVLDALGPAMADPPDEGAAIDRLLELLRRNSGDPELPIFIANFRCQLGVQDTEPTRRALKRSDAFAISFYWTATLEGLDGDVDRIRAALWDCVHRSPTALDCLSDLQTLEANEGNCAELDNICRMQLARFPESPGGYECLGNAALPSAGAPWEAVTAALSERAHLSRKEVAPFIQAQSEVNVAIARGRLEEAAALATAWKQLVVTSSHSVARMTAAFRATAMLQYELGRKDAALALVHEYTETARLWSQSSINAPENTGVWLRALFGDTDTEERTRRRNTLLAKPSLPHTDQRVDLWTHAYADLAWSRTEALEAVANAPTQPWMPQRRFPEDDYRIGRVFALAGDKARAIPFLRRAARSCGLADDFYRTKSKIALATLVEDRSDEACALYRNVATHWLAAPSATTTGQAVQRGQDLNCHLD